MCLTGIHGQIYMAWTAKKTKTKQLSKDAGKELSKNAGSGTGRFLLIVQKYSILSEPNLLF